MRIRYSRHAAKGIDGLEHAMMQRIKAAIEKLPAGDVKKLKGFSIAYRLRVGDYRILFDMERDEIRITNILHRREAYQK